MPFKVLLPIDTVIKLRDKLTQLHELHRTQAAALDIKIQKTGATEATVKERAAMKDRAKRLTVHYLLRAMVTAGMDVLDKKTTDLLALVSEDTVSVGRPRGPRAA